MAHHHDHSHAHTHTANKQVLRISFFVIAGFSRFELDMLEDFEKSLKQDKKAV